MRALMVEALEPDYAGCFIREFQTPEPKAGEVVVKVKAAAVNFPDLLQTRGEYQSVGFHLKTPVPYFVPYGIRES